LAGGSSIAAPNGRKFGAVVTQPYSPHPHVPTLGSVTNLGSFQLTTLPSFRCGDNIELALAVRTDNRGDCTIPVTLAPGAPGSEQRFDSTNAPLAGPCNVRLSWPTWATGFNLQRSLNLRPSSFVDVASPPVVVNGEFTVTNSAAAARRFHRLVKP